MQATLYHETLWHCIGCDGWWLSRDAETENSWRLYRLPSIFNWQIEFGKCAVWRVHGPDPSICPECGFVLKPHQPQTQSQDHLLITFN